MAPLIFRGLCCIHQSCDLHDFLIGYKSKSECLCFVEEQCLALDEVPLGIGLVTDPINNEFCKIGVYCCAFGVKKPERCCALAAQFCCIKEAGALPLDEEYQGELIFSYYFCTCLPKCGFLVEGPDIPALKKPMNDYKRYSTPDTNQMDRFDDEDDVPVVAELVATEVVATPVHDHGKVMT